MTGIDWLGPLVLAVAFGLTGLVTMVVCLDSPVSYKKWERVILLSVLMFIGFSTAASVFGFWMGTS
jgi:predicted tellurium resistance membrane protein TerC